MDIQLLIKAIIYIFLAVVGIPGNVYIFLKFTYVRITEKKLLTANFLLMLLVFANFFVVISRVIPHALHSLGVENLLDDKGCIIIFYTYRVSRAMSICATSLLSFHQCILIAPVTKFWMYLKEKVTKDALVVTIIVLLVINCSLYSSSIIYSYAHNNSTSSPYTLHLVYCNTDFKTRISYVVYGVFYTLRDYLCVGLMVLTSGYIIYVLLNHKKNVKLIRSSQKNQAKSIEYKASRGVILLVALYVTFFGLDNSIWVYTLTIVNPDISLNDVRIVSTCSFSALSPAVIIITNPKLQMRMNFSFPWKCFLREKSENKGHVTSVSSYIK
ncbi:olfactory receptor class A-like protein 1 [Bombina bombina]|uniref:olfactory receptor class A-like protein 1 n=1 Tax=Bombina bombina TaxID=8345 RepID=UPI00235AAD2F|nr:olfactory receptor class A-like protein 1 [Bombina bombina]